VFSQTIYFRGITLASSDQLLGSMEII